MIDSVYLTMVYYLEKQITFDEWKSVSYIFFLHGLQKIEPVSGDLI